MRKLTLWQGDPGVGKSYVSLVMAAALSQVGHRSLIMQVEDGIADTMKPRLDALGADSKQIRAFASGRAPVLNLAGIKKLEAHMADWKPSLVVVDPVTYFLGADRDMHRANEVRECLAALAVLASHHNAAIVPIIHMNKGSQKALYRALGSIDFIAAVRSVCMFGWLEDEPDRGRAMFHIKCNVGPREDVIGFDITGDGFEWRETDLTLAEIEGKQPGPKPTKSKEARAWLARYLEHGPVDSRVVRHSADEEGIKWATLERISREPRFVKERIEGSTDSMWSLRPLLASAESADTPFESGSQRVTSP
jgi:hypothetical protein